jgi:hypothetical protein
VSAELSAFGPVKRPYRDYLAALGLGRGRTKGIDVTGVISWDDRGLFHEQVSQSGTCSDALSLQGGLVGLNPSGRSVEAAYFLAANLRTRCPGPIVSPNPGLLTGVFPRGDLSKRSFTLTMRSGSAFEDDGYVGRTGGHLSLTVRRGRISSSTFSLPND